jgi:hypothetical protein
MAYFKETYSRYDGRLVKNCQKKEKWVLAVAEQKAHGDMMIRW